MDAIKLLKQQHKEVDALFERFESSDDDQAKRRIFNDIADHLAIHAAIEEKFFYPVVRARKTEDMVVEAYDEHLEIKKLLVDARDRPSAPGFDGMVAALKGVVQHHVEEEEDDLFPAVRKIFGDEVSEALGQEMEAETLKMKAQAAPRNAVKVKSEAPAHHP